MILDRSHSEIKLCFYECSDRSVRGRASRMPELTKFVALPPRRGTFSAILTVFLSFCVALASHPCAVAQSADLVSRSYVTPFPAGDLYKLYVFGDTLGDGISAGLEDALSADGRIEVTRKSGYRMGFSGNQSSDLKSVVENALKSETIHIVVLMLGVNERQSISVKGKRYAMGTPEWRNAYGRRIDAFLDILTKARLAAYWVGLPVMRSPDVNEKMQALNDIYRERAFLKGVKFIDTWNRFVDDFGRYSAYGPDIAGQVRRLRTKDGVHFTPTGYLKLAHFVEREISRDLAAAKAERNLPLAGDKDEQARAIRSATAKSAQRTGRADGKRNKRRQLPAKSAKPSKWDTVVSEKVSKGPKGEELTVKTVDDIRIIRPRIPDVALATALARRDSANYAGEMLAKDIDGGMTALSSVSPSNDLSLKTTKQRVPLTQLPYYKVLIKGEKMTPRAGRADDFSWPRAQLGQ